MKMKMACMVSLMVAFIGWGQTTVKVGNCYTVITNTPEWTAFTNRNAELATNVGYYTINSSNGSGKFLTKWDTIAAATGSAYSVRYYQVLATNYSRTYKTVGQNPVSCTPGCLVYHFQPVLSDTDYYEIETVTKKTMLKYTLEDDTTGETCVKEDIISRRQREVTEVVVKSVKTNGWVDIGDNFLAVTNLLANWGNVSLYATNIVSMITNISVSQYIVPVTNSATRGDTKKE